MLIEVLKKVKIWEWQVSCSISWWCCRKLSICDTRWSSWNNYQCSLYPAVTYYQQNDKLKNISHCVSSHYRKHDAVLVYEVQKTILAYLNSQPSGISTIIYFTDGCTRQYKYWEKKLTFVSTKVILEWTRDGHFFATSHGKQPFDEIGGTVRRLVSNASSKRGLKDKYCHQVICFNVARKKFRILSSDLFARLMLITQEQF